MIASLHKFLILSFITTTTTTTTFLAGRLETLSPKVLCPISNPYKTTVKCIAFIFIFSD
jgi:hypothetical protein